MDRAPEATQRAAVIAEARTWLGTKFEDNQGCKGAGVDCAHLVAAAYEAAGVVPDQRIAPYSPQHMLHSGEELFLGYVRRAGAREIAVDDLKSADLVLYKIGRVFAHGAIVIDWPREIIHAHKQSRRVLITGAFDCNLSGKDLRAFSFWVR